MPSGAELEIGFWLVLAVLGVVGELLTGSFFLLPFAIGAGVAAIAAAFGAELPWALALFLTVSLSSLFWLRHLARRSEASAPPIQAGAGRYIDAVGKVTADIGATVEGRVRIEGQTWRARAADGQPIPADAAVRVVEVRGTALVVEEI